MKKIIGIGLVTAALLAGCGSQPNTGTGTGADTGTTAVATTAAGDVGALPTAATGSGEAGDIAPDATVAANETAVSGAGATAPDATMMATSEAGTDAGAQATMAPADSTGSTDGSTSTQATMAPADSTTGAQATVAPADSTTGAQATVAPADSTTGSTDGAMTGAYQTVQVPELGLSFQVPEGWEQVSGENAWSPAGVDIPRVGVESASATGDWRPSSFLPEGGTVKSSQQLTLGGMQAMFYTVENTDGTAETHAIMRNGETAYDFYARAESLMELQTIQPVLNDIVGSVLIQGA